MASLQYGLPILVGEQGGSTALSRLDLRERGAGTYDEAWLQELLFRHPEALPVEEIDRGYEGLVPVCMELNLAPAGFVDALYVTPSGKLALLEAKLWRNPEARREVVGQILDYATHLSRWTYEDLLREVARSTKRKGGNVLFQIVHERHKDADEAQFVDEVSRSLKHGRFLLLVAGDGIREGVQAIAQYLNQSSTLHFTFGLVEMAIHSMPDGRRLLQPRVLAKTVLLERTVTTFVGQPSAAGEPNEVSTASDEPTEEAETRRQMFRDFWTAFLKQLRLDDQLQPYPKVATSSNIYCTLPTKGAAWISAYAGLEGGKSAGVYLTFPKSSALGEAIFQSLKAQRTELDKELPPGTAWIEGKQGKNWVEVKRQFADLNDKAHRPEVFKYLAENLNTFVNVFRHRLAAFEAQQRLES